MSYPNKPHSGLPPMCYKIPGHETHEGVYVRPPMTRGRFWELVDLATEGDTDTSDAREMLSEIGRHLASRPGLHPSEIEYRAEAWECAMMHLDDLGVPREDEKGEPYSLVGRIDQLCPNIKS